MLLSFDTENIFFCQFYNIFIESWKVFAIKNYCDLLMMAVTLELIKSCFFIEVYHNFPLYCAVSAVIDFSIVAIISRGICVVIYREWNQISSSFGLQRRKVKVCGMRRCYFYHSYHSIVYCARCTWEKLLFFIASPN